MRLAISDLVSLRRFISWAIWKAITRLAAVASEASRICSHRLWIAFCLLTLLITGCHGLKPESFAGASLTDS